MVPRPLPPTSLPLRFSLQSPLRSSSSPTACLSCLLPFRCQNATRSSVEDVRNGAERPAIEVYRILDPEHREPFISLARIFLAVGISPLEGLLLYIELRRPAYDSTLAGIAPFIDLWVPLKTATTIAEKLELADELAGLLDWSSRLAYSVEDKEEGGMVHNWKIGSDKIDPAQYSTSAMLSTAFPRIHLLPQGSQVRTLLPPTPKTSPFSASAFPSTYAALYSHITDWTISEHEMYESRDFVEPTAPLNSPQLDSDMAPSLLFTSLLSLLSLVDEIALEQPSGTVYTLAGLRIDRSDIVCGTEDGWRKGRLGLVDAMARLVAREWRMQCEKEVESRRRQTPETTVDEPRRGELESRMGRLEQAIDELKMMQVQSVDQPEEITPREKVDDSFAALSARVDELEQSMAPVYGVPKLEQTSPDLWNAFIQILVAVGVPACLILLALKYSA